LWIFTTDRVSTHVIPDGHGEDHGNADSSVESGKAADLGVAVTIAKGLELRGAELGRDGAGAVAVDALDGRARDLDLLSVLDEELGELVLLELGDDAVQNTDLSVL